MSFENSVERERGALRRDVHNELFQCSEVEITLTQGRARVPVY